MPRLSAEESSSGGQFWKLDLQPQIPRHKEESSLPGCLGSKDASKAKESLNNLDTRILGREVISSCAGGYVTIPAITLGGVLAAILVRTINANRGEFKDGCHPKRAKDTKTGGASTADLVSKFMRNC